MPFRCSRVLRIAAAVVIAAIAFSPAAQAKDKKKKPQPAPKATAGAKQPDKELYDKALASIQHGHYDVARLQLQALLNTYPDSEYQMRAKLAIGDSWYREGGTAALTQAEAEYKDFITFFPNAPEAAEAQMRVADIYYKQMEKPDRDFSKAQRAEQEYRLMIQQFPDSSLVPRARQRLREVQEVLAQRLYEIGYFYSGRQNWPATIARYQTLVDTYPLYSGADHVLVGLGDAYAAQARIVQNLKGPEDMRAKLAGIYLDHAAQEYDRVLTRYPAAPGAADARARLIAMHRPVPKPTRAAYNESVAEVQSRAPVTLTSRALLLVSHSPQVLEAARVGDPDMEPPPPTTAPQVRNREEAQWNAITKAAAPAAPAEAPATAPGQPPRSTDAPSAPSGGSVSGTGASLTVIGPTGGSGPLNNPPEAVPGNQPASDAMKGLAVKPTDNSLPAVEKPAEAPTQTQEIQGQKPAATQTASSNGKKPKRPKEDKSDESSTEDKKKKKGLAKLNPF